MFRGILSLSAGVLALLCVAGSPDHLHARGPRPSFRPGIVPRTTRMTPNMNRQVTPGFDRRFTDPRFGGFTPGFDRRFSPGFGGFTPGFDRRFSPGFGGFTPGFGGLNTIPVPIPVPVPSVP